MTRGSHPPDRARKLKKAWVEKVKIKSKWRAEKRKAGLLPRERRASPSEPRKDPDALMEQPPAQRSEQTQHPVQDGPSLRELGKSARRKGQPDMKSRMNALLAKIKRDHQN